MGTTELRKAMKAIDGGITVSGGADGSCWAIRNIPQGEPVRAALKVLGLVIVDSDVEGGRHDWTYSFYVTTQEDK